MNTNDGVVLLWEDANVTYQIDGIVHPKTVDATNYLVQAGFTNKQSKEYLSLLLEAHSPGPMAPDPYNP